MPFDLIVGRNDSDKKAFGMRGLAYLGKNFVTMGNYTSLSNPIYMDVVRSHVVLVSGKRGSGKCLHGDSLISLEDGRQVAIRDLAKENGKIVSMNDDLKMGLENKGEFFSREVGGLLRIRLRSGREIKLTPEHPVFTVGGWVPIGELGVGGRIATPRIMPNFGDFEMKECEVKLLSYLIAEGHTKKIVLFSNMDEEIVEDFREALNEFDSSLSLVEEKKGSYRVTEKNWKTKVLEHDSIRDEKGQFVEGANKNVYKKRSIRELIEREGIFGKLATEKFLSENLMRLNRDSLRLFLNRLFSCDGSIYKSGEYWEVSYASSSEKLIRQVQSLLLRFGILSSLREKQTKCDGKVFDSFELVLNLVNGKKFVEEIGFFGVKVSRAEVMLEEISGKVSNPNVDTIPKEIWDGYKPESWTDIGRKLGYKHPKAMRERLRYCPSRETLARVGEADSNEKFKLFANSDIFWDEIVSVEVLEGKETVYDICVPGNHNFVANDIIVHNSYSLGVMAEALGDLGVEESGNIASVIFDTMGIYWTMKYKNLKDAELLAEWGLSSKNVNVRVFAPFGYYNDFRDKGVEVDAEFAIKISELEASDWVNLFELKFTDPVAVLIEGVISSLRAEMDLGDRKGFGFLDIRKLIDRAKNVSQEAKNAAVALFDAAETWKVFDEEKGTSVREMITSGVTTVIDLSMYASLGSFNVRALIIGLVSKKIFDERMKARKEEEISAVSHGADYERFQVEREMPLVWIFIDEAHEFLPHEDVGRTPATDALVQLLREGRQPGVSMVLATQQPGKIHSDVMTQSDIVISHRVTAARDVLALNEVTQSYMRSDIAAKLNSLPHLKGSAIILDDNSERIYPMRVRPRFTWHGGEAPMAIKKADF